ncbi:MAG: TfoX/Sxy family protein [Pseudomonadota bacterium]
MAVSPSYIDFIKDLFSSYGDISVRKMFGGAGVYRDGRMFALIADDELWLKADDDTRAAFEAASAERFSFVSKGEPRSMSYYRAPEEMFDDPDILRDWADRAMAAAMRAPKPKPKTKK